MSITKKHPTTTNTFSFHHGKLSIKILHQMYYNYIYPANAVGASPQPNFNREEISLCSGCWESDVRSRK